MHDFILKAVSGDQAAADAIFEDYLAGKLSEELLSISRCWVSADQAGSSKCEIEWGGSGATDDGFCVGAGEKPSRWAPIIGTKSR